MTMRSGPLSAAFARTVAGLCGLAAFAAPALAHPHVWVDARYEIVFDASRRIAALDVAWTFDPQYTDFFVDGLDADGDGAYSDAELRPHAVEAIDALEEYGWYVDFSIGGRKARGLKPRTFAYSHAHGALTLSFTLPLAAPVDPRAEAFSFVAYDPSFYVDLAIAGLSSIRLRGEDECVAALLEPQMSQTTLPGSAGVGLGGDAEQFEGAGAWFARGVRVDCP